MSKRSPLIVPPLLWALTVPAAIAATAPPARELSLEETRARLVARVAEQRMVPADDIQVAEAEARTWPDASLGCEGKRRLMGSSPVAGYRFVLVVGGQRLTYHADARGSFRRCDSPTKPLGPIARATAAS
jgi:hypothetical protein